MRARTKRSSHPARLDLGVAALQEDHAEFADLNLVAAIERRLFDALPVHVRAVEATDVPNGEPAALPVELRMAPGDRDVIEEDVAVWPAADFCELAVEQESAAFVRPAPDHEQRRVRRQRVNDRGVGG